MNIFDILQLDAAELGREQEEVVSLLRKVGLTEYEAHGYMALVMLAHGTAEEIADLASIPRTSAYKVLESLKQKGYASSGGGRPNIYYPAPPEEVRDRLAAAVERAFYKIEQLQGILSEKGTPQLVYTITGKEKVMNKIGEMLDAAKGHFFISSPALREIVSVHASRFANAVKRGVKVTVVAEPSARVPEATEVVRRNDLLATDVITDSELAMIASPDLTICGYSDNPFLAAHLENFMNIALNKD